MAINNLGTFFILNFLKATTSDLPINSDATALSFFLEDLLCESYYLFGDLILILILWAYCDNLDESNIDCYCGTTDFLYPRDDLAESWCLLWDRLTKLSELLEMGWEARLLSSFEINFLFSCCKVDIVSNS